MHDSVLPFANPQISHGHCLLVKFCLRRSESHHNRPQSHTAGRMSCPSLLSGSLSLKPTLRGNTCWKTIDGDLSTLGKLKAQMTKFLNEKQVPILQTVTAYFYFNTYLFKLDLEGIPYAMLLIIPVNEANRLQASGNPYYISYGPK